MKNSICNQIKIINNDLIVTVLTNTEESVELLQQEKLYKLKDSDLIQESTELLDFLQSSETSEVPHYIIYETSDLTKENILSLKEKFLSNKIYRIIMWTHSQLNKNLVVLLEKTYILLNVQTYSLDNF